MSVNEVVGRFLPAAIRIPNVVDVISNEYTSVVAANEAPHDITAKRKISTEQRNSVKHSLDLIEAMLEYAKIPKIRLGLGVVPATWLGEAETRTPAVHRGGSG